MDGRDRDSTGRARNARPRDALGQPLPHGSRGVDRVPEDVMLSPDEALRQAQRFIDDGYPFHAHEVLEGVWKATEGEHRELWQGLAQLAVGLTHVQRGNPKGAVALLRRGADRIDPYAAVPPHGLDVAGLAGHARSLAARIERDGLDAVDSVDLRPRLAESLLMITSSGPTGDWPAGLPVRQVRIARPTDRLDAVVRFYRDGLGLAELFRFDDHAGYNGVMLGLPGTAYHLEFTQHVDGSPCPAPTRDNLLVLYFDAAAGSTATAARLAELGYPAVPAENPYWTEHGGITVEDPDGWRVVLMPAPVF